MRPAEGRDEQAAPSVTPDRQAPSPQLQSAFASNSALRFSEDQGRPPLSGRRSTDTEGGRSSTESRPGDPPNQTSPETLNR